MARFRLWRVFGCGAISVVARIGKSCLTIDVRNALQKLKNTKLFLKESKCEFFKTQLDFMGHTITHNRVDTDKHKMQKVTDWPQPKTVHQLRHFMGFCNYFRRFIQDYATIAAPLHEQLKSTAKQIDWTPECTKAFTQLKHALVTTPTLRIPNSKRPFTVTTDASDFALGAILTQDGHPVAYESRKFNNAELNYTTREKELLAIVHALKT